MNHQKREQLTPPTHFWKREVTTASSLKRTVNNKDRTPQMKEEAQDRKH